MAGADQYRAKDFIDAIPGTGGIITTIARRVGCSWHTAKKYIDNYATVQQAYQAEKERVLDKAEINIIDPIMQAENPDTDLSKWYLTMKGRSRGYAKTERHEVEGGGEVVFKVVYEDDDA